MSNCPMAHFPLARTAPTHIHPEPKLVYSIALGTDGKQVTLAMQQDGKDGQDYIAIEEDTLVEVLLRGDQLFFSKAYEAITLKGPGFDYFYGALEYGDYDRDLDRYKSVQFVARHNKGGKYDTTHGFNVNVDLLQAGGKGPRFIPITIDPDIKNPPPKLT